MLVEISNPPSPSCALSSPPASPPSKRAKKAQPAPPSASSSAPPSASAAAGPSAPPSASAAVGPSAPPSAAAAAGPSSLGSAQSSAPPSAAAGPPSGPSSAPPSDQEEDDDDTEYPLVADFFLEKDPKTNRHKWLVHYYKHLFTPDAGFHKDKNRLQHASQVKRIIEQTNPNGEDITFMADDEGSRIWIDWVVPNLKAKKPGMVKSYLTSLEIFLGYVTKKGRRPYLPPLDPEVKDELFDFGEKLKKWRQCVTKETSSLKWDRYRQESDTLLTNNDVYVPLRQNCRRVVYARKPEGAGS